MEIREPAFLPETVLSISKGLELVLKHEKYHGISINDIMMLGARCNSQFSVLYYTF